MKDGGSPMNEHIFHRLYDDYHSDVFHFLIYMLKDRATAEDLSHEVYIRAIKAYERFENKSSEKTWLFAIAKNVAIDHFRKQKIRSQYAFDFFDWESEQLIGIDKSPEEISIGNEENVQLYRALDECSGDQKTVIILRYIQQLSIAETAKILEWSESKVKTTQHRAIKQLKLLMAQNESEAKLG